MAPEPFDFLAGPEELTYCLTHLDSDSACFFAADTTLLDPPYLIEYTQDVNYVVYGDCPEGFYRGGGMFCYYDIYS